MNFLSNFKIGTQLRLGFGIVIALMLILVAFALVRMTTISTAVRQKDNIYSTKLQPLYAAREALDQTGLAARNAYVFPDDGDAHKELDIVDEQKAIYLGALKQLEPLYRGNEQFVKVSSGLLAMAEELKRPRKYRESGQMAEYGAFLVKECSPLRRQIVADIEILLKSLQQENQDATELAQGLFSSSLLLILILAAAILAVSVALIAIISRGLLKQLGGEPAYAAEISQKIAQGDLTVPVEVGAADNNSLLFAMKQMRDSLTHIVTQVRQATDTIATASSEIVKGNMDLSSRTEQQAGSLEETASAMEELTSTVKQSAENARQANQLAGSAFDIASRGGEVVRQVVDTMSSINESSRKIVDIISVIDGIAFQTNILALNAAVEAARAGEQGRGFAVVATEVRSLAQRSASAAKEIKQLIDDSVAKVEIGSDLVLRAGDTMDQVVAGVRQMTDIVAEISASSQEQSEGIEQINQAVGQMDRVTQQNAALVEEAAAAAQSLQVQVVELQQTVSVFRLDGSQRVTARPQPAAARRELAAAVVPAREMNASPRLALAAKPASRLALVTKTAAGDDDWKKF